MKKIEIFKHHRAKKFCKDKSNHHNIPQHDVESIFKQFESTGRNPFDDDGFDDYLSIVKVINGK